MSKGKTDTQTKAQKIEAMLPDIMEQVYSKIIRINTNGTYDCPAVVRVTHKGKVELSYSSDSRDHDNDEYGWSIVVYKDSGSLGWITYDCEEAGCDDDATDEEIIEALTDSFNETWDGSEIEKQIREFLLS